MSNNRDRAYRTARLLPILCMCICDRCNHLLIADCVVGFYPPRLRIDFAEFVAHVRKYLFMAYDFMSYASNRFDIRWLLNMHTALSHFRMIFRANETSVAAFFVCFLLTFPAKHEKLYVLLVNILRALDPLYITCSQKQSAEKTPHIRDAFFHNLHAMPVHIKWPNRKHRKNAIQMNLLEKVI